MKKRENYKQKAIKMFVAMVVTMAMIFALVAFGGCNERRIDCYNCSCCTCSNYNGTLVNYKAAAIEQLQGFAVARGQENFSEENWARIEGYVAESKARIAAAESSFAVILIVIETRCNIKSVPQEEVYSGITAELEVRIRQTILEYWHLRGRTSLTIDDVWFLEFGYYNGAVAIRKGYDEMTLGAEPWHEIVSDIYFSFRHYWPIVIWHENSIFSLIDAFYEYNILTMEYLLNIQKVSWNGMDKF